MQCSERMIEAGLCTQQQYDHGKEELLQMMTSYYETREETVEEAVGVATGRTNKWDKKKREAMPADKAMKDFEVYESMCNLHFLPEMEPVRVVGTVDNEDQVKEPVYAFGKVTVRGMDINKKGLNHADYVNRIGMYNTLR